MIVRRATFEDLEQLAVLFDEYRQFYGASSNFNESLHFLKQRFENRESVFFIHIKDDKITGFILLYLGFSSVACSTYYILDDVYVTPVFRRQGSAKQLYLQSKRMLCGLVWKLKATIMNLIAYMNKWDLFEIASSKPSIVFSNDILSKLFLLFR